MLRTFCLCLFLQMRQASQMPCRASHMATSFPAQAPGNLDLQRWKGPAEARTIKMPKSKPSEINQIKKPQIWNPNPRPSSRKITWLSPSVDEVECMYGRLDVSSLLSSSKTMAGGGGPVRQRCGRRRGGRQRSEEGGTSEEGESGDRARAGPVRAGPHLSSERAGTDSPAWQLARGPGRSVPASIRRNTRFSPIRNGSTQTWYWHVKIF